MYAIIYDFFYGSLGLSTSDLANVTHSIGGASLSMAQWLAHTATIAVLAVLCFTAFKFVWWLVRMVGNAFQMRG